MLETHLPKSFSVHQKAEFLDFFPFQLHLMQHGSTEPGESKQSKIEKVRSSAVEFRAEISQRNKDAQDQQNSPTLRPGGRCAQSFVCCLLACFSCLTVYISGGLTPQVTFAEKDHGPCYFTKYSSSRIFLYSSFFGDFFCHSCLHYLCFLWLLILSVSWLLAF